MKNYQVGKIKFSYKYNFNNYFSNNIEKYEIKDNGVQHHIIVSVSDEIDIPKTEIIGHKNPYITTNGNERVVFYKNKNKIGSLMRYDLGYNNIEIVLNKTMIKNLVMAEYIFSGIMFLELAQYYKYLPLHASAIKIGDDVLLFSAPSGTGKTTHRKYWQELFSDIKVINDDKPLLFFSDKEIKVYGTPFSGEDGLNTNTSGKLKGIVFLKQGLSNNIRKLSKDEKIKEILRNTVTPKQDYLWDQVLSQVERIITTVPIIELDATNNHDSVKAVYDYFYGGKI